VLKCGESAVVQSSALTGGRRERGDGTVAVDTIGSVRAQQTTPLDLEALSNLVTPIAVRVAATLRLADHITDGVTDVPTLAQRCGAEAGALRRLLIHLSAYGVFEEHPDGTFGLGPTGQPLRSKHPGSMRRLLDLDSFSGRGDLSLMGMLHSVRTGEPAYEVVHGRPYWADLVASPEMVDSFDEALRTMAAFSVRSLLRGYDWSKVSRVVDVGGGIGAPLCRLLQAQPHLRATLIDMPDSAARAARNFADAGLADRAEAVGGSYFDPLPAGADVYLLCHVVDQEPEDSAVRILRHCAEAAGPDGAVLLLQTPVTRSNRRSMTGLDLLMLTSLAGAERTVDGYRELVAKAGLELASTYPSSANTTYSVMLLVCVPA
jgi:hypothetical protein